MDLLVIFVVLLVSWILIQSVRLGADFRRLKKQLPPGPTPLPLIGNLLLLGKRPHQSLAELAQIYGPIMSLKLGWTTTIVISSSSTAKEVLKVQDLAFSSRSVPDAVHALNHSQKSVVWLPVGIRWRNLRKIMTNVIFSNNRLDANHHLRARKVEELIAYCYTSCKAGETVDISRVAFQASLNLMSNTIFSKDLTDPNQDSSNEFKEQVETVLVEVGKPNLADYFPLLNKIDPQGIRRRSAVYLGKLLELFDVIINERLDTRKVLKIAGSGDMLDLCLDISEESPEEMNIDLFKSLSTDLFFGATDTTTSTIEWAMAELLRDPEEMMKAKEELDQVIGKGKIVKEADISQLPYLHCIMKEILRLHPPVPFLVPRKVKTDAEVNGYVVPKGSQVIVNVWAIGRDPTLWEDSLKFKPERFLTTEKRDFRGQDFELIPFGGGRRICPGLPLAIRMVTVMLGSLINSFDWKLEGNIGPEELDMSEKFGLTLHKETHLCLVPFQLGRV